MEMQMYKGDEAFDKILEKFEVGKNVYEIKMYMLGFLWSPENISPFDPLEEILLKDTEDEITFKDENEAGEFHSQYIALWNLLTSYEGSDSRYPKLSPRPDKITTKNDKVRYLTQRGKEVASLVFGMDDSGASEYIAQSIDLTLRYFSLHIFEELLIQFLIEHEEGREFSAKKLDEIIMVADDFEKNWHAIFKELNAVFLGLRRGTIPLQEPEEIEAMLEEMESHL